MNGRDGQIVADCIVQDDKFRHSGCLRVISNWRLIASTVACAALARRTTCITPYQHRYHRHHQQIFSDAFLLTSSSDHDKAQCQHRCCLRPEQGLISFTTLTTSSHIIIPLLSTTPPRTSGRQTPRESRPPAAIVASCKGGWTPCRTPWRQRRKAHPISRAW